MLRAVHKRRPQSGGFQYRYFVDKNGGLQMRTALFGANTFGFFEIYGVPARTRGEGVEPVRTFCGQREY